MWRDLTISIALLASIPIRAQVRINELQCAARHSAAYSNGEGNWVELYNAGSSYTDLDGFALALAGRTARITGLLNIPAKHSIILKCDGHPDLGADHLDLTLPSSGGTLILVAPDGSTLLDIFHWPPLPPGISTGPATDGSDDRAFFADPTPGNPNSGSTAFASCASAPVITWSDDRMLLSSPVGGEIRYTLDGSIPDLGSPLYSAPLVTKLGMVVTARSFAPNAAPGLCSVHSFGLPTDGISIALDPEDLQGEHGIADQATGNYARKGPTWQRSAWLQTGYGIRDARPVGIAVAGSGSRSLAKKSFKLMAKARFGDNSPITLPDGTAWANVLLRADATPNSFLRNLFIEEIVHGSDDRVDVETSSAVTLFINGRTQGLYRAMPSKGTEWAEHLAHGANVDLIEGPGASAVSGSAKGYVSLVLDIAAGADLDTLQRAIDLGSLIDLACLDMWTGRADHDLNVRAWRPRTRIGRWRWVEYDMDLWAPVDDNTVERLCGATSLETPYLPQLLAHAATRDRLLARLSALLATALASDRAGPLADSLYRRNAGAMGADHDRWHGEMECPAPDSEFADLMAHIENRAPPLLGQLAAKTGKTVHNLTVSVEPLGAGSITVEDLPLTRDRRRMDVFDNVPMIFRAIPSAGMEFTGWKGAEGKAEELKAGFTRDTSLKAQFRPLGPLSQSGLKQGGE